ncbi:MAG: LysM domain-containing protein [Thermoleophilia bacterium]
MRDDPNTPRESAGDSRAAERPDVAADEAALERLRALSADVPGAHSEPAATQKRPAASSRRSLGSAVRASVRMPAGRRSGGGRVIARIAAPVVFLVAVIVLVVLLFQSGLIGNQASSTATSTPTVTSSASAKAKSASTTKTYVVKSGDTLSAIALKFKTSVAVIEELNPKLDGTTLVVGTKIKVPRN